jgi:hypothetical protein
MNLIKAASAKSGHARRFVGASSDEAASVSRAPKLMFIFQYLANNSTSDER